MKQKKQQQQRIAMQLLTTKEQSMPNVRPQNLVELNFFLNQEG